MYRRRLQSDCLIWILLLCTVSILYTSLGAMYISIRPFTNQQTTNASCAIRCHLMLVRILGLWSNDDNMISRCLNLSQDKNHSMSHKLPSLQLTNLHIDRNAKTDVYCIQFTCLFGERLGNFSIYS